MPVWFTDTIALVPGSKEGWFLGNPAGLIVHALSQPEPG